MAIAFTYTESTNIVVVTGGTSGTPATFADFVAADRGDPALGTPQAELLPTETATTGHVLTYPMRPIEEKALRLEFTTAANGGAAADGNEAINILGTTGLWTTFSASEAAGQTVLSVTNALGFVVGDVVRLIDISAPATTELGTVSAVSLTKGANTITVGAISNSYVAGDIIGINQEETIDTSAGHGAFWTVMLFGQLAYFDCIGYDGTNTVAVDQSIWGVIWDYGGGQYRIDAEFDKGDASTSTYFASELEMVYFNGTSPKGTTNATVRVGKASNDYSDSGSFWRFKGQGYGRNLAHGTTAWEIYDSIIKTDTGQAIWWEGTIIMQNVNYIGAGTGIDTVFGPGMTDMQVFQLYITQVRVFDVRLQPSSMVNIQLEACANGLAVRGGAFDVQDALITNAISYDTQFHAGADVTVLDPRYNITSTWMGSGTQIGYESYTCNIHAADKGGPNLASVDILIQDKDGETVSYADSETDLNEALDISETGVDVDDGTKFAADEIIKIDNEYMYIDSISTNTLTVQRGYYTNYPARLHVDNSDIYIAKAVSTDANGDITELNTHWKKFTGLNGPATVYTYTPHKFTLSKPGYETFTKTLTINQPINEHWKLQPIRSRALGRGSRRMQVSNFE